MTRPTSSLLIRSTRLAGGVLLLGSLLVTLLIPLFGILLALIGTFGALVVAVVEIVYLYKTSKTFLNYYGSLQHLD